MPHLQSAIIVKQGALKEEVLDKVEKAIIDIMEVYKIEVGQATNPEHIARLGNSIKSLLEAKEVLIECCNARPHGAVF